MLSDEDAGRSCLRAALFVAFVVVSAATLRAQSVVDTGADTVVSFVPGSGSGVGREPQYFPHNVLGFPDPSARESVPAIDPAQILSLGLGGEITLRFDRHLIVDGPGPDFTVFENAFRYTMGGVQRTYAEPAEISVSRDGVTFVPFPFDSSTLVGCAGVTPTNGDRDPRDPSVSGGDPFDLATIGIDSVRFVRIHDVTSIVRDDRRHPFWDPTLNGFDLDAVVAVNVASPRTTGPGSTGATVTVLSDAPEGTIVRCTLDRPAHIRLRLFDVLGRQVASLVEADVSVEHLTVPLSLDGIADGLYFVSLESDGRIVATTQLHRVR